MTDDLSAVDTAQLEAWAFGRRAGVADAQRADAALLELARRAEVAQAEVTGAVTSRGSGSGAVTIAGPVDDDSELASLALSPAGVRHRRRMLATGYTGVAAAVLATLVGVNLLMQPNPDPLAIFERPLTQLDVEWQAELDLMGFGSTVSLGPRVLELGDDRVAIVFRTAARADGGSTEWDPYCLLLPHGEPGADPMMWTGACVFPEEFERDGITVAVGGSDGNGGVESIVWGPVGQPRLEGVRPADATGYDFGSVLSWLMYPNFGSDAESLMAIVNEPDRLLLGPSNLHIAADTSTDLTTHLYLIEGLTEAAGPQLCLHVAQPGTESTTNCEELADVRQYGWGIELTIGDDDWMLEIGPDSSSHSLSLRPLNPASGRG